MQDNRAAAITAKAAATTIAALKVSTTAAYVASKAASKAAATAARAKDHFECVSQSWDYDHPCPHCGYICLVSDKNRKQCCLGGRALDPEYFPILNPMPRELHHLAAERIEHMSSNSTYYNNILSLGATGIDNGTSGGYEKMVGDHAIKLNGRTYHYLPKTGGAGGLEYFTFDALEALETKLLASYALILLAIYYSL